MNKDIIISNLIKSNCIKTGIYTLKSKELSKYYFNIKNLISYPKVLKEIGDAIYQQLDDFDIICAIPHGSMPLVSYISTTYNKKMIFIRDSVKTYGTKNQIEGEYNKNDKCVILDDVITSGNSLQDVFNVLKNQINIVQVFTVIDRQQLCTLLPFKVDSLLTKTDIVRYRLMKISQEKNSRLIFSADLECVEKMLHILEKVGQYIVVCKIHLDIYKIIDKIDFFKKLIDLSIKYDFLLMEDRKFNDIGYIVQKQYQRFSSIIDLVTVHGSANPSILQYLSGSIIVSNMSNSNDVYNDKALKMVEQYSKHIIGFVSQYRFKYVSKDNMIFMTPGISLIEGTNDDQHYKITKNVDTDFYIVGRSIYNSSNIYETIKAFQT